MSANSRLKDRNETPRRTPESGTVRVDTTGGPSTGGGTAPAILTDIHANGGTLEISRGQLRAKDLAALSKSTGNEFAIFRDRATRQLFIRQLGPLGGQVPENSRLILHSQPGAGPLAVQPSPRDRAALARLRELHGQRSSVIINEEGTFSIRFRSENVGDNPIRPVR